MDSTTQALLHSWFPTLYPAPDTPAQTAPDRTSPAPVIQGPTPDAILTSELGGAFGGSGNSSSGAPGGAFGMTGTSDPGSPSAATGSASSGHGGLGAFGNAAVGMAGNYALGQVAQAIGVPGMAVGAAVGLGKGAIQAYQTNQELEALGLPGLTPGEVAGMIASQVDPTQGFASGVNGLASLTNSVFGTNLNANHQGIVGYALGLSTPQENSQAQAAIGQGLANQPGEDDLSAAASAFHDALATASPETLAAAGTPSTPGTTDQEGAPSGGGIGSGGGGGATGGGAGTEGGATGPGGDDGGGGESGGGGGDAEWRGGTVLSHYDTGGSVGAFGAQMPPDIAAQMQQLAMLYHMRGLA